MIKYVLAIILLISTSLHAVTMSTDIVAGFSAFRETNTPSDDFDSALNFSVEHMLNDTLSVYSGVSSSLGQSDLGFSLDSFDLAFNYTNTLKNYTAILGSYSINFSHYSNDLSNNGSFSNVSTIMNPLLFNFFTQSLISDLGVVGLNYQQSFRFLTLNTGVFNNFNSSSNDTRSLGRFVNFGYKVFSSSYLSLATMQTNSFDISSSFNSDITAWIVAYCTNFNSVKFRSYLSGLNYKTKQANTDSVFSYLLEVATQIKKASLTLRYDSWIPNTSDINSIYLSSPAILATSNTVLGDISRLSVSLSLPIDKMITIQTDIIHENYDSLDSEIVGVISYAKVGF